MESYILNYNMSLSSKLRAFRTSDLGLTLISDLYNLIEELLITEIEKDLCSCNSALSYVTSLCDGLSYLSSINTDNFDLDNVKTSTDRIGLIRALEVLPVNKSLINFELLQICYDTGDVISLQRLKQGPLGDEMIAMYKNEYLEIMLNDDEKNNIIRIYNEVFNRE